jgi:hypothetical protein
MVYRKVALRDLAARLNVRGGRLRERTPRAYADGSLGKISNPRTTGTLARTPC